MAVFLDSEVLALDLAPVRYQLAVVCGWSLARIVEAERQYRCFLQLIRSDPLTAHAPTRDADECWHQHILCTALYLRDCQNLFGAYVHHYPFSGRFGADDAHQQRQRFEQSRARIAGMIRGELSSSVIQQPGDKI
jgi:hypothetical protein